MDRTGIVVTDLERPIVCPNCGAPIEVGDYITKRHSWTWVHAECDIGFEHTGEEYCYCDYCVHTPKQLRLF